MHTRELDLDDWPAMWAMLQGMGTPDDEETTRARFAGIVVDDHWLVLGAEVDGELVGYAAVQDYGTHLRLGDHHRMARMHDLFVVPERRQQGIGHGLVDAVMEWARPRIKHLEWQAGLTTSAPFYEKLGYRGEQCPQPDYPTFNVDF